MLNIPDEIKELYLSDNVSERTHKKIKLTFYDDTIETLYPYETLFPDETLFPSENGEPWIVIENNRIESGTLTITESLSESQELEFGSCNSTSMEIVVANVIEDIVGREFALTVEIGGYELALGIYTVESFERQADRRKRKITARDRMQRFNTDVSDWYNSLNFPVTLRGLRNSLCEYVGVNQTQGGLIFDSLEITKTIEPTELSGIDVLKAICQINGCFGHVDKTGELKYISLQQTGLYPSEDLFPDENLLPAEPGGDGRPTEIINTYKEMRYEDYLVYGVSGLTIRQEEGHIGANVGTGDNSYTIEGNFLVYGKTAIELLNIAQSLLPLISERAYKPATLETRAMPWVEVGDLVVVPTKDDIVETFVMKRILKGGQAMTDTIESTGSQRRKEIFGINKQIIQLEGKTAVVIKNVDEVSVRVTDLKQYTESQFKVTADSILAEVTRAKGAEEELSSSIKINAERIELKVSKGEISSQISLESEGVNISGNRLTWNATNSSMTADGTLTCNNIKAINGNFSGNISGSRITGSEIRIGPFSVNDYSVYIGDYNVTTDGTYNFGSNDGSFYVETASSSPSGSSYGHLFVGNKSGYGTSISGGNIYVPGQASVGSVNATGTLYSSFYDIKLKKSWWGNWTITETVQELWDQVQDLSDRTVKSNIGKIDKKEALNFLLSSNPVTFQYIQDGRWSAGFIAQEVEELENELEIYYPLVMLEERTQKYRIEYKNYIPLIIAAIQNLQSQIDVLNGGR